MPRRSAKKETSSADQSPTELRCVDYSFDGDSPNSYCVVLLDDKWIKYNYQRYNFTEERLIELLKHRTGITYEVKLTDYNADNNKSTRRLKTQSNTPIRRGKTKRKTA